MAEITLDLLVKADRRGIDRAADDIQKRFRQAGDDAATDFTRQFTNGMRNVDSRTAATNAAREFGDAGRRGGQQFADAASDAMRRGDYSSAGREAARDFQRSFERAANPKIDIDARSTASASGSDAGDSFAGGFAGAAGMSKLAGKGGPIATAIAAAVAAGMALVGPEVSKALQIEASTDLTAARLGLDDKTVANVAKAAADAFAGNWGASIDANLSTATSAIQSGLLAPDADAGAIQRMIAQLTDVSTILGEDIPAVSRSAAQALRTGIATDATNAFDLMVKGQQAGLNASQDFLDTINEYSTQFRKLGLTGPEAFGLLTQAVQGGARDTDVAADALKEFSIRVVDGSKTTRDAFTALGLDADAMAAKFAVGGRTSADAFDEVVDKVRGIKDPVEQSRVAVELFGTQAEDLGGALNRFDLSTAVEEFGKVQGASQRAADQMVSNSQNEWQQAGRNIQRVIGEIGRGLASWSSFVPNFINGYLQTPPTPPPMHVPAPTGAFPGPAPGVTPGPAVQPPVAPAPRRNPLDVFAPTTRDGQGGPTAADFYGPNASGVDPGILQIADIAKQFGLTLTSGRRNEPGSYHNLGAAGDFGGPVANMRAFAEFLNANYGDQMQELIFSAPGWSGNLWHGKPHQYSAGTLGDHEDHVHAALRDNVPLRDGAVPVYVTGTDASGAYPSDQTSAATTPHGQASSSSTGTLSGPIGFPLDADFGLSNGLAGAADNATRAIANMALAPVLGPLAAIAQSNPIQGGHGLFGIMGAQNIANGLSPLGFGPSPAIGSPTAVAPPMMGPFGPATGPLPGPQAPVGKAPGEGGWQPSGGAGGGGGALAAAGAAGGMALDMMAPGAGQAASTAMQLIQRSIQFGGQVAAIGVQGLMETFGLSDSVLGDPQMSWMGRLAAGFAGARPALPSSAGQTQAPVQPQQHAGSGQAPGPQPGGPTVHIDQFVQAPNRNGQQAAGDLAHRAYQSWGRR